MAQPWRRGSWAPDREGMESAGSAWRMLVQTLQEPAERKDGAGTELKSLLEELLQSAGAFTELPPEEVTSSIRTLCSSLPARGIVRLQANEGISCKLACQLVGAATSKLPSHLAKSAGAIVEFLCWVLALEDPEIQDDVRVAALRALGQVLHDIGGGLQPREGDSTLIALLEQVKRTINGATLLLSHVPTGKRPGEASTSENGEIQRLVLHALDNLFTQCPGSLSDRRRAMTLEVLKGVLEGLCTSRAHSWTVLQESAASSRLYAALLRCLQATLADAKQIDESQIPSLVSCLRLFLTYGTSQTRTSSSPRGSPSPSWRAQPVEDNPPSTSAPSPSRGAYRPPHLRGTEQKRQPQDDPGFDNWGLSSDSEMSDSDGLGSERFKTSRVRIGVLGCIEVIARLEPKLLHSQWQALLPTQEALQPRPSVGPSVLTPMLFDPMPRVRLAAAATLAAMLEGSSRAFLQAAEWREGALQSTRGRASFQPLSVTLGLIVRQLHTGLLHVLGTEAQATTLAMQLKALSQLMLAAPYSRLPADLLSTTLRSIHRRAKLAMSRFLSTAQSSSATSDQLLIATSALSCLATALSITPPSSEIHQQLSGERPLDALPPTGHKPKTVQKLTLEPSVPALLADLLAFAQSSAPTPVIVESLSCLKAAAKTYSSALLLHWSALSRTLGHLLTSTVEDKVVQAIVKVLDELLRGIAGKEDSEEEESMTPLSRHVKSDKPGAKVADEAAVRVWEDAVQNYLATLVLKPAPMVRAASMLCFGGLTEPIFSALSPSVQTLILAQATSGPVIADPVPSVRAAACRALGVLVGFTSAAHQPSHYAQLTAAVIKATTDPSVAVCMTAAWALGNLCGALKRFADLPVIPPSLVGMRGAADLEVVAKAGLQAAKSGDKIRANAVRALGNLASFADFPAPEAGGKGQWLDQLVQALLSCITTGNVKVQWNVCHAFANLFKNPSIALACRHWLGSVYHVLLLLLRESSNFKIRIHAASALAVPQSRPDYGEAYADVVQALILALESLDSDSGKGPVDYKYKVALRDQLSGTLVHVLALQLPEPADALALRDILLKKETLLQDWASGLWAAIAPLPESATLPQSQGATLSEEPHGTQKAVTAHNQWSSLEMDERPLPLPGPRAPKRFLTDVSSLEQGSPFVELGELKRATAALALLYEACNYSWAASEFRKLV